MKSDKSRTAELLRQDLEAIYIGNLNTVDKDLILPEAGENGSVFTWATGEERFIDGQGRVHRPLHGMGNRKVLLTVTGCLEGETDHREFTANVIQMAKPLIVESIRPVKLTAEAGTLPKLPPVVIVHCQDGRDTTLPVVWEQISDTRWIGTVEQTETNVFADVEFLPAGADRRELSPGSGYHAPDLRTIRLLPGSTYQEYQQRMNEYLLSVDDDQLLYNFRIACGLDTRGAEPMTGWDAADCRLKGHTTGHYLSGLALAWAVTGEEVFARKIEYMVDSLEECQEAFAASGETRPGFLSAYSEEQFDLLERYTKYPEIWAPYYTLDKIMSGLMDCRRLAGSEKALSIERKMGDWVYARLSRLPQEQLDRMWSMYIAGEFGGMIGTMVKLYEATGEPRHLAAAKLFLNEKLFYPMEQGVDTLEDMHGNQHIPQIMGAMDLYRVTGEERYRRIAENFWRIVTGGHIYTIGGLGETEMFHRAGSTCSYLTDKSAESCASYNMLRLTGQLVRSMQNEGETSSLSELLDYYENTLHNHILTSCSHTPDGGSTYFLPLGPGGQKEYSTEENTCCHGTGMESRFRYMEDIYGEDGEARYVNLLIPSEWKDVLRMTEEMVPWDWERECGGAYTGEGSDDPAGRDGGDSGKEMLQITIDLLADQDRKLRIHVPGWAREEFIAGVTGAEGREYDVTYWGEDFLEFPAGMAAGTRIELEFPMVLRPVSNNSDDSYVCAAYGPSILAMIDGRKEFVKLPVLKSLKRRGSGRAPEFTDGNVRMIPFNRVDRERYHVYFRR